MTRREVLPAKLKSRRCLTGQYLAYQEPTLCQMLVEPLQGPDTRTSLQVLPTLETLVENPVGGGAKGR